jgi:hypothetical protein
MDNNDPEGTEVYRAIGFVPGKLVDEREASVCGNCRFWCQDQQTRVDSGDCRKLPPTRFGNGDSGFPQSHKNCWCGEFRHKDRL